MKTILLVEDDETIRQPLAEYLSRQGYNIRCAGFLSDAKMLLKEKIDCIVLDWSLPDGESINFAQTLKSVPNAPPILILTARTSIADKVLALESAAQDYMTKPYDPRELLARVKNLLTVGKSGAQTDPVLKMYDIEMDMVSYQVRFEGDVIELSNMEYKLLKLFLENPGKVFSREELLNLIWGYDRFPTTRTVDNHVLQLRNKFFDGLVETVRGVGYRCKKAA
jgi:DNA-binding response OmpR family regulator